MKTFLRYALGFSFALSMFAATSDEKFSKVPFKLGQQAFASGDKIVITEVLSNSPQWGPGDCVMVRGTYQLKSADSAKLAISLSTTELIATRVGPDQRTTVTAGSGKFELWCEVQAEGSLRMAFSPLNGSASFGTVFFHPAKARTTR